MSVHDSRSGHGLRRTARTLLLVAAVAAQAAVASAQAGSNARRTRADDHWVPTWGTAQQLIRTTTPAGATSVSSGRREPLGAKARAGT